MKKKILVLIFFIFSIGSFSQNWMNSLEMAKKIALASNKLIFVDFTASWCGPCKKMESDVWSKKDTQLLMSNFVSVQIDIDHNKDVARKYNVNSIPNLFILDGNGKIIENIKGYKNKSYMDKLFKKYSVNTEFLQQKLISFYKKPSYSSALRLASKYQIYSIYLDDELKGKFLNVATKYFDIASKLVKKSKIKNKKMLIQKIELLKLRRRVIKNKPKKVLNKLKKYKPNTIDKSNKSLFAFLHYVSFKQLGQDGNAVDWLDNLNEKDKELAKIMLK